MHRTYDKYFKHTVNPDGSTRTECLCIFSRDNRKCQFVAVRDPGGKLWSATLYNHLLNHHMDVFEEKDEWWAGSLGLGLAYD